MSARQDLTGQTFGDVKVLESAGTQGSQALYKCLCPKCKEPFFVTSSNLKHQMPKGCNQCRNSDLKKVTEDQEREILEKYKNGIFISDLTREYKMTRGTIYKVLGRQKQTANRKLTIGEQKLIYTLYLAGVKVGVLTRKYKRTYDAIYKVIKKQQEKDNV
jgi:Mor family transcriptional regulator